MGNIYDDDDVVSPDDMATDGYALGDWADGDLSPEECDAIEAGEVEAEDLDTEADDKGGTNLPGYLRYLTKPHGAQFTMIWEMAQADDDLCHDFDPEADDSLCTCLRGLNCVGSDVYDNGGVDAKRLYIGAAELACFYYSDVTITPRKIPDIVDKVISWINDLLEHINVQAYKSEVFRRTCGGKKEVTKEIQREAKRVAKAITPRQVTELPRECIVPLAIGLYGLHLIDTSDGDETSESATKLGYYDDGSRIFRIVGRDTKGLWVTDDDALFRLVGLLDASLKRKEYINDIIPQIKAYLSGYEPRYRKVNRNPFLIACKNGVYDWKTKSFRDFSRDDTFLWKLRVPYNPAAVNPIRDLVDKYGQPTGEKWDFDSWIYDLFTDDSLQAVDSQRRAKENSTFIIEQWLPYMLTPSHAWDKSFIFCGEQGTGGKGCLIFLIRSILGDQSMAEIKLKAFDKDFILQELWEKNKRIIVSEENEPSSFLDSSAVYKAIITGDYTAINLKFKAAVTARIRASQTHCINGIPRVGDKTDSYTRRHCFLRFHKNFNKTGEHPEIKQEFLCDPDVLEYVLKLALEAPYRKVITPTESMGEVMHEFKTLNNPMERFWDEVFDFMDKHVIELPTETLYPVFQTWYKENVRGASGYGSSEFKKMLRDVVYNDPDFMYDQTAYYKNTMSLVSDAAQALFEAGWITYDEVDSMLYAMPRTYRSSIKRRELTPADSGKIGIRDSFGKVIQQYETVTDDDAMRVRLAGWDMTEVEDETADEYEKDKKKHWIYTNKKTGKKYEKTPKSCFGTYGPAGKYHVPLILRMCSDESPVQGS